MQPRIYQFQVRRSVVIGVYEAYDTVNNCDATIYEWTPALEDREAAKIRLAEIQDKVEGQVFSSEASLYLSVPTLQAAEAALETLRAKDLFVAAGADAQSMPLSKPFTPLPLSFTPPRPQAKAPTYPASSLLSGEIPAFEKAECTGQTINAISSVETHGAQEGESGKIQRSDSGRWGRAVSHGVIAAVVGSILYAAFTIITHIEIGYLALGVGYLIGKAMLQATGGSGGRKYQIVAAILTYLAVSMAAPLEILWRWGHLNFVARLSELDAGDLAYLAKYGFASPFLELRLSVWGGLISLIILFVGMRAAWGLTADRRVAA